MHSPKNLSYIYRYQNLQIVKFIINLIFWDSKLIDKHYFIYFFLKKSKHDYYMIYKNYR